MRADFARRHLLLSIHSAVPIVALLLLLSGIPAQADSLEFPLANLSTWSEDARTLRMVRIPAGTFQMGAPESDPSRNWDECPVHPVSISYDFYLGESEVTQAQWWAVMGSLPDEVDADFGQGPNYPVYAVSWNDITAPGGFLERINAVSEGTFRLPSESEWEYACRAGTTTRFSFGDSSGCYLDQSDCDNGNFQGFRTDHMWFGWTHGTNGYPKGAKPVGLLRPNPFGLYDMHGNVWEWVQDWYVDSYDLAPSDGSAVWTPVDKCTKVFRGGHWGDVAWYTRSTVRGNSDPDNSNPIRGFRLAWNPN